MDDNPAPKRLRSDVYSDRFTCDQCQRSFGRVEHLKRHIGSHTEERPYKCPTCNKSFLRSDTLQRHELIHSEGHNKAKAKGARACVECASAKVKCTCTLPCARCSARSLVCQYPRAAPVQRLQDHHGSSSSPGDDNVCHDVPARHSVTSGGFSEDISGGDNLEGSPSARNRHNGNQGKAQSPQSVGRSPMLSVFTGLSNNFANGNSEDASELVSPDIWSQNNFSAINWMPTGLTPELQQRTGLTPLTNLPPSPQAQKSNVVQPSVDSHSGSSSGRDDASRAASRKWLDTVTGASPLQSQKEPSSPTSTSHEPQSGTSQYYVDGDGARLPKVSARRRHMRARPGSTFASPSDNSSFHVSKGSFGFSAIDLPSREMPSLPISTQRLLDERAYGKLRESFDRLCTMEHKIYPAFTSTQFPGLHNFNGLILLYLENIQPALPIFHVPTLDFSQQHWLLGLALAALGSQFLDMEHLEAVSISMLEFLRRAVTYFSESREASASPVELAQAQLLLCIGLAYTGDDIALSHVHRLHRDAVSFCLTSWPKTISDNQKPESEDLEVISTAWHAWKDLETKRRTGYAIWLLDCMLTYHHQWRPQLTPEDASIPLPCPEILWEASSALQWRQVLEYSAPSPSLLSALQRIYIEKRVQSTMGEFARIILIHGLFHRSWQVRAHLEQPLTYWAPSAKRQSVDQVIPDSVWLPEVPVFAKWRNSTCDSLDILHWSANSVIGAASGMEHPTVAHLHLSRIILLTPINEIRTFVLESMNIESSQAQLAALRKTVQRWAREDQHKARLAMIHAGVVFWHIRRYSVNAFYEPHAVFLAALALWAYGTFSSSLSDPLNPSVSARQQAANTSTAELDSPSFEEDEASLPTSINLDRPADDELVQTFIRRGGRMLAMMSGVGDICGPEGPSRVLGEGVKLLGTLGNWGVSAWAAQRLSVLRLVQRSRILGAMSDS